MTAIHDRLPIHRHDDPARREPGARTAQASEPARAVERTLPRFAQSIPPNADFQALVDEFKLELVYRALAQSGGNHRRAAALIGVHRSSFTRMLHRLEAARNARQATRPERIAPRRVRAWLWDLVVGPSRGTGSQDRVVDPGRA